MAYRGRLSNGTRSGLSGSRRFESCRLTSFVAVGGHRLLAMALLDHSIWASPSTIFMKRRLHPCAHE